MCIWNKVSDGRANKLQMVIELFFFLHPGDTRFDRCKCEHMYMLYSFTSESQQIEKNK